MLLVFADRGPIPECKTDVDCPSKYACFSGQCKNPCIEVKPCGKNAECTVVDYLPLRTMLCSCLPGYVGDADVECRGKYEVLLKVSFTELKIIINEFSFNFRNCLYCTYIIFYLYLLSQIFYITATYFSPI